MTNAPRTAPFSTVDDVLAAAAAPPSPGELRGEPAAVAAFRAARPVPAASRRRGIFAGKAAVAAVGALGLLTASGAAAATGSLPDAAQDAAHGALTKVGVDVPRGKGQGLATAPGQLKQDGESAEGKGPKADKQKADKQKADKPKADKPKATGSEVPDSGADAGSGHGATISSIAKDPTLTGVDKGAAVSAAASDGKSHAGQNQGGPPAATPAGPPAGVPGGPPASSPSDTAPGKTTSATAGNRAAAAAPGRGARP